MKKIELWYKKLPINIRNSALDNRRLQLTDSANHILIKKKGAKVESLWEAVNSGFKWNATPEGHEYWKVVKRNLQYLQQNEILNKDTLAVIDRRNPSVNYDGSIYA